MNHEKPTRKAVRFSRSLASSSIGVFVLVITLLCGVVIGLLIGLQLGTGNHVQRPRAETPPSASKGTASASKGTASASQNPPASFPGATNTGFKNAPGYPGRLTDCSGLVIQSNTTYRFCDFPNELFVGSVTEHPVNVTFIGCRFASHNVADTNVADYGKNITFSYSTFEPNTVAVNSEPVSPYAKPISAADSYQYGVDLRYNGALTIDHSDFWGFSDAVQFAESSQASPVTIINSWIHNPSLDPTGAAHVDAILDSYGGASYMTFSHNTIVGNGNTQAIALQGDTAYQHVTITNNYFSGYGYTICIGTRTPSSDVVFTGNVLGSDIEPTYGLIYNSQSFTTAGLGNVWRDNKFYVVPGTSWLAAGNNKLYWWPDDANPGNSQQVIGHTADYTGP
jgi:hypothetical protein